jgi:hypothetical protein
LLKQTIYNIGEIQMALNKEYVTRRETTVSYHRIRNVMFRDGILKCTLLSYESKEAREANINRPLAVVNFTFSISPEEETANGIRPLCYKKIKELEAWADAEDC